jgi:predicted N-acetyltransferase YhbS
MPEIALRPPTPADTGELGRICYEAFKDVSEAHGFESDFTSVEMAQGIIGGMVRNETVYGTAALVDGKLAGSNFVFKADDAAGIGPVNVDPARQGLGLGRRVMEDVLRYCEDSGFEMVRLVQDAFNMVSMSLYASLGFDTKAPLGLMRLAEGAPTDDRIRLLPEDEMGAADDLCLAIYRISRRNELANRAAIGMPPLGIYRGGALRGYLCPGMIGHGVAETEEDMLALMRQAGRIAGPSSVICPLTEGSLFRRALADGHRLVKIMNLMTLGPYEEPQGVWIPSVGF